MSTSPGGQWTPRTPLTVARLAKIANSFGYNLPAAEPGASARRSPSPIPPSPSLLGFAAPAYVLQVIPPHDDLPYDSDALIPPPANATGYHPKYSRGILVPLKPTLQSQLGAIAREYALPSSVGLVLYLVNDDSPGPRLSEDIWKILWSRVVSSDNTYLPPASPRNLALLSPGPYGPSPYAASYASSSSSRFASNLTIPSPGRPDFLDGPPLTPNSATIPFSRSLTKSAPPSSVSPTETISNPSEPDQDPDKDPDTPPTSMDHSTRANSFESSGPLQSSSFDLPLPGLSNSRALIPILAKVEFEIDKRKATWYAPWIRSRRLNLAKRRAAASSSSLGDSLQDEERSEEDTERKRTLDRQPVIDLTLGTMEPSVFSIQDQDAQYAPLTESPIPESDPEATIRLRREGGATDPLADVFGEDEDEWGQPSGEHDNENVVPLALTAQSLDAQNEREEEIDDDVLEPEDDVQEVQEMIKARTSLASVRKQPPPPLLLRRQSQASHPPSPTLPYLRRSDSEDSTGSHSVDIDPSTASSGSKSSRRKHGIYDDMEVDLDQFSDSPDGRDQMLMKAQLDAIEKTLVQLSPRTFEEFEEEQEKRTQRASQSPRKVGASPIVSPRSSNVSTPREISNLHELAEDPFPATPTGLDTGEPSPSGETSDDGAQSRSATPFSSIKEKRISTSSSRSAKSIGAQSHSSTGVPQVVLNGVSHGGSPVVRQGSQKSVSDETSMEPENLRRMRDAKEEDVQRRESPSSLQAQGNKAPTSPVIPLSPDPFGRFSSTPANGPTRDSRGNTYWEDGHPIAQSLSKSSRFSADEEQLHSPSPPPGESLPARTTGNRSTIMSVKGFKKLWRKSSRSGSSVAPDLPPVPPSPSVSTVSMSSTGRMSPALSNGRSSPAFNTVPQRPSRPQEEIMELPSADDIAVPRLPAMLGGGGIEPSISPTVPDVSGTRVQTGRPGAGSPANSVDERPPVPPITHSSSSPPPPSPSFNESGMSQPSPYLNTNFHPHFPAGSIQLHPTGPQGKRPRAASNAAPILPAKMLPGGGRSEIHNLNFDQETPYPVPSRKPSVPPRGASRPASPNVPLPSQAPSPPPSAPAPTGSPPFLDGQSQHRPKSILKSRSSSTSPGPAGPSAPPSHPPRARRTSLLGRNSSLMTDLPPSPKIPEQFLHSSSSQNGGPPTTTITTTTPNPVTTTSSSHESSSSLSLRSKSSLPSLNSHSGNGSRSSHEEPEEFDDSQFEIVHPTKSGSAGDRGGHTKQLSYPYTELET